MGTTTTKRGSGATSYFKPTPSEIHFGKMRFLITDRPNDATISHFIQELNKYKARAVVRVCEPTYATDLLETSGITVLDWQFSDGSPPPLDIIEKWLALAKDTFGHGKKKGGTDACIAVHCVAGLGRAPVLVALALIEAGMKYEDAVELIRKNRRGALNEKQLTFLEKYKASGELRKLKSGARHKDCSIM